MTRAKVGVVFDVETTAAFPLLDAVGDLAEIIWVISDGRDGGRLARALLERSGHVVEVVSGDPDAAAESLRDQAIEGILTFSDEHIVLTAEIAQRLELPGCPPHVAVTGSQQVSAAQGAEGGEICGSPRSGTCPPDSPPASFTTSRRR